MEILPKINYSFLQIFPSMKFESKIVFLSSALPLSLKFQLFCGSPHWLIISTTEVSTTKVILLHMKFQIFCGSPHWLIISTTEVSTTKVILLHMKLPYFPHTYLEILYDVPEVFYASA